MPSLEEILHKVVLADSEQINQGTIELREAFKSPDIIPSLCQVMGTSSQVQIRQYSAVLLRKRLARKRNWLQLSTSVKKGIRDGIIQAMVGEPERIVRNSMAQLIGVLVKHMKSVAQQWPELLQFLQRTTLSNNPSEQELGTLALAGIAEMGTDALAPHLSTLCQMFKHIFENSTDITSTSVVNTITCMKLFVSELEKQKNCNNVYSGLVPMVLRAVTAMAPIDEDKACHELELLEDLLDESVSILQPHISVIITTCLHLAGNQTLGSVVRNKAILLTGWIASKKKKSFLKLDLLRPTVDTMFRVMCDPYDEQNDEEEDFASAPEASSPNKVAAQAIDALAMCLPPDKLMPLLAEYVEPAIQGDDPDKKRAAYLVLAVVVEGCNAYVRTHCLEPFVLCIAKGITDSATSVRNSALYALGQFSDHLQPEINKFAPQLVPVLFTYLDQLCSTLTTSSKEPAGIDRMFYALETFIENLEDDLNPYLPALMERLLLILDRPTSPHLRQLALSAIGAAAQPAKLAMLPYFPRVIEVLKVYLTQPAATKDLVDLQVQSLDTLGLLARGLGPEHFMPLARESIQLGLTLVRRSAEEADVRKASYGLFAAMSTILKEDMEQELADIMPCIMQSIKSNDGIVPHFKEDADKALPVFDDDRELLAEDDINEENSDSDEEDACSDLEGYSLKNSYTEEKEEALDALKELACSLGVKFNPYVKESFDMVYSSLSYPDEDVKTAALGCVTQLCINWHNMQTNEGLQELREALLVLVPKVAELVHCDCDHAVVMACMELYATLLKELKGLVIQDPGHKEAIINCIRDVIKAETDCQKQEEIENLALGGSNEEEDDGDDAEQDEMLFQYSADVLAPLGNAMPSDDFAVVFKSLLPIIISKTKKQCSIAQRSFATGMLAECMAPLGPSQLPRLINQLFPLLLKLATDQEEDVRSNAIYALGEMAKYGKEPVFPHFPQILAALSVVLTKENGAHLLDNICGAIARLIIANVKAVPLDQVLPVLLHQLPIRSDFEESQPVSECISYLYQLGCPQLVELLERVVFVSADLIKSNKASKETCVMVLDLLRSIQRDFPDKFEAGVASLSPADAESFKQCYFTINT